MRVAALGLCLALVGTAHAQTPVSEVLSAAALVAPFDQSEDGHTTLPDCPRRRRASRR